MVAESWGRYYTNKQARTRRNRAEASSRRSMAQSSARQSARRRAPIQRPQPQYRAPIQSSSSGRYSAPSAPSGGGSGPVKPIKPKPKPPSLGSFLGKDSGYQNQLRQLAQALSGFESDYTRRRGTLKSEHKTSSRALGKQRLEDLEAIEEDFGSRGLLKSGLYAEGVGDYEKEYGERSSELSTQLKRALAQLSGERSGFRSKQRLSKAEAREAAAERRAAKYGL